MVIHAETYLAAAFLFSSVHSFKFWIFNSKTEWSELFISSVGGAATIFCGIYLFFSFGAASIDKRNSLRAVDVFS